jgi:putative tryptophan/tyrosine transport system substrate-binding protein
MRRREFIARLGAAGAYAAVPRLARAQQDTRVRRVAILQQVADAPAVRTIVAALRNELARLGWVEGNNLRIDLRFAGGDPDRMRANATEIVSLAPDVIVATGTTMVRTVQRQTETVPIVILGGTDVLSRGLVKNLARPEGNATGVASIFQSIAGKWVELLKEAVPRLQHLGYFYNAQLEPNIEDYFAEIEKASRLLGVRAEGISVRNAGDIERSFDVFAAEPDGGLVVPNVLAGPRATINALAMQYRIPAVCRSRLFGDCLIATDPSWNELTARTASFVDRILRGAKPGELPVEYPTRFEVSVNLKIAKAIGVTIPETFLVRADEVIE